jgi:hypothetical protein
VILPDLIKGHTRRKNHVSNEIFQNDAKNIATYFLAALTSINL